MKTKNSTGLLPHSSSSNYVLKFLFLWLSAPSYRQSGFLRRLSLLANFRDLFTAIYIDIPSLRSVEKLFHLNSKTGGKAYFMVSRSPLTNDGFRSAWKNLTERFENKWLQVNSHLRTLYDVESIAQESGAALRYFNTLFKVAYNFPALVLRIWTLS